MGISKYQKLIQTVYPESRELALIQATYTSLVEALEDEDAGVFTREWEYGDYDKVHVNFIAAIWEAFCWL